MSNPKLPQKIARDTVNYINKLIGEGFKYIGSPSAVAEMSRRTKINTGTIHARLRSANILYGLLPVEATEPKHVNTPPREEIPNLAALLIKHVKGRRKSTAELASITKADPSQIKAVFADMVDRGVNVHTTGDTFEIPSVSQQAYEGGHSFELVSRPDNTFLFGAAGDLHAASKYCRWDVRDDLYNQFIKAGAQCNFDTGNWIDGDAPFNKFDLEVHGLESQCRLLAERHPKGLPTLAVWGADHEGWIAQREGVDVGKYNEIVMREEGHDWTNLGFMEAHIKLTNANTGQFAMMSVVHPGGGSAYALSYSIQKIIESYEGGEKPAVGLYGHYHKLWAGIIRNVWCVQTGCQEDQTPFMRQRRLEAHVGGVLVGLDQDPDTGAITSMTPKMMRYFNTGYYDNRWSKHGSVTQVERKKI